MVNERGMARKAQSTVTEHKLFDGDIPYVSTYEFHADRPRAAHLEQDIHKNRLYTALSYITYAESQHPNITVSDLGCGDGGLLQLIKQHLPHIEAWGYDFHPASRQGWRERHVEAYPLDVFGADRKRVRFGTTAVCTEVLEHLADPHDVVRWIGRNSPYIVASSPATETPELHDPCHAWAWDMYGYRALFEQAGYTVLTHERVGMFQVILGGPSD